MHLDYWLRSHKQTKQVCQAVSSVTGYFFSFSVSVCYLQVGYEAKSKTNNDVYNFTSTIYLVSI